MASTLPRIRVQGMMETSHPEAASPVVRVHLHQGRPTAKPEETRPLAQGPATEEAKRTSLRAPRMGKPERLP